MKTRFHFALTCALVLAISSAAVAQTRSRPTTSTPPTKASAPAAKAPLDSNLESVLNRMDAAAQTFRSAQADFVWDQYQMVVDETDTQKGVIYFRRHGRDTDMAADVKTPESKYLLFSDGKLRLYQPRIDQVTEYNAGKNRAEVESFLVLGFGSRGHDLLSAFTVKYLKKEPVDGTETVVLELVPLAQKVRSMFNRMLLWIDPVRGVSVKQQFFEPSGDYRLAHYENIRINHKVGDEVFKLKTTANTKTVSPQG